MALSYENLQLKVEELETKVKELETELYFCYRNYRIKDEIQKRK